MSLNHIGSKNIEINRLLLRKFKKDDAKEIFETWLSDADVAKYMVWNPHNRLEETNKWLEKCISKYNNNQIYHWGIELKENNKLIGSISANAHETNDEYYEIGYTIGKKYWNNGYATETLKATIEFLNKEIGISKFICRCAAENIASEKVIKKVGFKYKKKGEYSSLDGKRIFKSNEYYLEM